MKIPLLLLGLASLCAAFTNVRFAHISFNTTAVDVLVNGTLQLPDVKYDTITQYWQPAPGHYDLELVESTTKASLFNGSFILADNHVYTLFLIGNNDVISVILADDNNVAPADQFTAKVRFFQGVSDLPTAEVVSVASGAVIATINYKEGVYVSLAAGSYNLAFQAKGSTFYHTQLTVAGGNIYTVAFTGLVGAQITSVNATDSSYQYYTLRASHLSPDAAAVDIYLNDAVDQTSTKIVSGLQFKANTDYALIPFIAGRTYTMVVTPADHNDTLASHAIVPAAGQLLTITIVGLVAKGTTTPLQIIPLVDDNTPPADSWTNRVRFFHALPGTVAVSVSFGDKVVFNNVDYAAATAYSVVNTGTYTVSLTSGADHIASADFTFIGGGVYTIFAEGLAGSNHTQPTLALRSDAAFTYFSVRATHAAPNTPTASFVFRNTHGQAVYTFDNVAYGTFSTYQTLIIQDYVLDVQNAGASLYTHAFTFTAGQQSTVTLFGEPATLAAVAFTDVNSAPKSSTIARVRFVHGVVGGPAVDVKFGAVTQFTAVTFQKATDYVEVNAGTYPVEVSVAGVSILTFTQTFVGGGVYTFIAEGIAGHNATVPVTAAVSADQTYQYFNLRVTHASSNAGNVDILLDDGHTSTVAFGNVQYQQTVGYSELVLANFVLKVTPAGNKNDVILSIPTGFSANHFYTVALLGQTGNTTTPLNALVEMDTNTAPTGSQIATMQFLHAVAGGAPRVDILFNDKKVFSNVGYAELAAPQDVLAGDYRIDVYEANTNNHLQALNDYKVVGGQVLTLVAMGTPGHIAIQVYLDAAFKYFQIRFAHTAPDAGVVDVSLEGQVIWNAVSFGNITAFKEFTSDKKALTITSEGATIASRDEPFTEGAGSSVILVGLKEVNATPIALIVNVEKPTVPGSNAVASLRIIHTSPNLGPVEIKLNETVEFTGVTYTQITEYKEVAAGLYTLNVFVPSVNHSLIAPTVTLTGGFGYTIFVEGLVNDLRIDQTIDYVPPSLGYVRFFHTSPNVGPVDLLVDGASDFRSIAFESASGYLPYKEGKHPLRIVPADQTVPSLAEGEVTVVTEVYQSVLFVGLQNQTVNETSSLEAWVISDEHTLPAEGDILMRFIHASPNAPLLDVRINGVVLFGGVTYKNVSAYHLMHASLYTVDLYEIGKPEVLLSSKFDLRVSSGSAIYTLVAEGIYMKDLKVVSFLDNGQTPPGDHSSSKKSGGLSGVAIGFIVAGVVVAVIAIAAGGFVLWRRKQRAGYSEIATHDH